MRANIDLTVDGTVLDSDYVHGWYQWSSDMIGTRVMLQNQQSF